MSMTLTQTCIIDGIISLHRAEFAGPGIEPWLIDNK